MAGVAGSGRQLPYADRIQSAFGRYDISSIRAHHNHTATYSARMLGADAYTIGENVVFETSPDLFTVAHEVAHVVQQRSGAVPADGIGRKGDSYERHADDVARAVVRGESAEPILDRIGTRGITTDGTTVSTRPVIALQRKIGFEFDTYLFVDEITDEHYKRTINRIRQPETESQQPIYKTAYEQIRTPPETKFLEKNTPLHRTPLYTIVADSKVKRSTIEFVTTTFDESASGLNALKNTLNLILQQMSNLETAWKANDGPFLLDEAISPTADDEQGNLYLCKPRRKSANQYSIRVAPQMTTAIPMKKLYYAIHSFRTATNRSPTTFLTDAEQERAKQSIREAKMYGLINLIRAYLSTGQGDSDSAKPLLKFKKIAGPLLARTSFSGLFHLLDPKDVEQYKHNPELFVHHVLSLGSRISDSESKLSDPSSNAGDAFDRSHDVFHRGVGIHRKRSGITIEQWLTHIPLGCDMLTSLDESDRDSLSGWDSFTELTGPSTKRAPAGVFEYREGSVCSKSTLKEWVLDRFRIAMLYAGYSRKNLESLGMDFEL